jgi:hypothetical protein
MVLAWLMDSFDAGPKAQAGKRHAGDQRAP